MSTALISVIVTTFNRPDALGAVLDGLQRQSDREFEVVIADDGSDDPTAELIKQRIGGFGGRLKHVWQPHNGFRAGEMRDRAILVSCGNYCIFLDGDCIPRPDFVARHRALAETGYFVTGNRVLLSHDLTAQVLRDGLQPGGWTLGTWTSHLLHGNANRVIPIVQLPLGPLRKLRPRRWWGARSCNLAVWRSDLDVVDGFDTAFVGWGREDSDLMLRLLHAGVRRKSGSFATGVLHLWHPPEDYSQVPTNDAMLKTVAATRAVRAQRGLAALREAAAASEQTPARAPALPGVR
jgi:glycosyltransferase involved in cell wall biosynthesis